MKNETLEEFFWSNFPHEITWAELKESNVELYAKLQNVGRALVLQGKLKSSYLKEVGAK